MIQDTKADLQMTDPKIGLCEAEVRQKIKEGRVNIAVNAPTKTVGQIIVSNTFTYFNFIFCALALLLVAVGAFRELTFMPIVIVNTLIGIVQEIRSKRVLDKLNILNAPHSQVLRNGKLQTILSNELVEGDIVIFESGDQICADAVVIDGEAYANEALLTGESDEIVKKSGSELMSGSFVVSGRCTAQLTKVGKDAYISKLLLEAKAEKKGERSEMIRSLNKLIKIIGIAIIPIGIIMFCEHFFALGEGLRGSIVSVVAALIGMIPEGLYLLTSLAIVLSIIRLAKKRVLVHEMACIETLARVDVLCVDKTGTITEPTMTVDALVPINGDSEAELSSLIGDFAANMYSDNSTMLALKTHFAHNTGAVADKVLSFSSTAKYSAVTFGDKAYVLGAPEFVLRENYVRYKEMTDEYIRCGSRVLVFGRYDGIPDGKPLTEAVEALCFVVVSNPIRKDAKKTFEYFAEQGVDIKVISGDNAVSVAEIARRAGIKNYDRCVDASTLTTDFAIEDAALKYTVFGRVNPEQKKKLVLALKKAGKTVAMTGDGVNDVLALKVADCSVAMASGSEAAANVSQLVLLDSDFACMPSVVLEGRRVVNNIERSASLFLVKNIFSVLMALFSMVFVFTYPLLPSQISLSSAVNIGIPAFLLALEPNTSIIKGKFLPKVLGRAMSAGLCNFIMIYLLMTVSNMLGIGEGEISVICALLMYSIGMMFLYIISRPLNKWRAFIWLAMLGALILCCGVFGMLFGIYAVSVKAQLVLAVFVAASALMLFLLELALPKLGAIGRKFAR